MIKKLLNSLVNQKQTERRAELYRNLIRREAKIGGQIFGPVEQGNRREFFCMDEHTWIWHEEWTDQTGHHQAKTTRYDIRPSGILKAQEGYPYAPVSRNEAIRLYDAINVYEKRVNNELYSFVA